MKKILAALAVSTVVPACPALAQDAQATFTGPRVEATVSLDQRLDTDGWRIGAGVETAISENAFAKIEYRYSNYKEAEFDFNGQTPDSSRFRIDTDRHQVVASVGLRF